LRVPAVPNLEGGELNGEVSNRRTLGCTASNGQTGAFCGEPAEEMIAASAANDDDFGGPTAGVPAEFVEHSRICSGKAVEDQCGHSWRACWGFVERIVAMGTKLRVDASGHVSHETKLLVRDIENGRGRRFEFGPGDELLDGERGAGSSPGVHALLQEPHAVEALVEEHPAIDGAEIGEAIGEGGGSRTG
jgi:hypothetical protein